MKETAFFNWLIENGKKENSARSAVSRIKRIEEVYPDLDSRYEDDSLETLLSVFTYTKKDEAKNREPLHKIQIDGDFYTGTYSLRHALTLYLAFRQQGKTAPLHPVAQVDADTQVALSETNKIYKIDEFREWMYWIHNMKKESASSYVSNLKSLRLQIKKESDDTLVMDSVGKLLEAGRYAEALNQLDSMDELASLRLLSDNIDASQKKRLNDWRSALRKYIYFLQEEMDDVPDEEELEHASASTVALNFPAEGETEGRLHYEVSELRHNFAFRIKTQNRMSNTKDLFFPIGMICKLFNYNQRMARRNGLDNEDADWLKRWIGVSVHTIMVITSEGTYPLSQISEMIIHSKNGRVFVRLIGSNKEYQVFTETPQQKCVEMEAKRLRDIHIDHTPLMADVLTANIEHLSTLATMTNKIRRVADKKKLDIKPSNFGAISKAIFADQAFVEQELLPFIPELKKDLDFLQSKCNLKLMQGSYNLRKK